MILRMLVGVLLRNDLRLSCEGLDIYLYKFCLFLYLTYSFPLILCM